MALCRRVPAVQGLQKPTPWRRSPAAQVMECRDVSKPSYALSSAQRMLLLRLHDGRTAAKAVEATPLGEGLKEAALVPGTKVLG